ncbi:hypothetical protein T09_11532, partial [Trichinella sp. T9]
LKYMQPVLNKWKSSTNSILFRYYKEHPHCGNDLLRRKIKISWTKDASPFWGQKKAVWQY